MVHALRRGREAAADRRSVRGRRGQGRAAHEFRGLPRLQNRVPQIRRFVFLRMRGHRRQQSVLSGGHTQLCRGARQIFPQRLRAGSGVQLRQGVLGGERDVPGGRNSGNEPNERPETTAFVQLV